MFKEYRKILNKLKKKDRIEFIYMINLQNKIYIYVLLIETSNVINC